MTDEAKLRDLFHKYAAFADPGGPLHGLFTVVEVKDIITGPRPYPHHYVVGVKHVTHASDRHGGILGEKTLRAVPCYWLGPDGRCNAPYEEHTVEPTLLLRLVRDLGNREAANALFAIKPAMLEDKLSGVSLVNLDKEFKIARPE